MLDLAMCVLVLELCWMHVEYVFCLSVLSLKE